MQLLAFFNFQGNTQERGVGRESPRLTELSEGVMKRKALSIIDDYLETRDIKVGETALPFKEN